MEAFVFVGGGRFKVVEVFGRRGSRWSGWRGNELRVLWYFLMSELFCLRMVKGPDLNRR